jgi:L-ascorbate metabolism protein UlaG (beta-lactamase superfamily)
MTLVRNATILIELNGLRLLVDPMLDEEGARPPVENTANRRRNPLVPLPMTAGEVVRGLDAVFITHLHRDHLDNEGERLTPRDVPVFCQPQDEESLRRLGLDARPVTAELDWKGIHIVRTDGRHGTGSIERMLAPVSGYVVNDLYIAGDTIWCDHVEQVIELHRPRVAVVNGGGARFVTGDPIVMTTGDVREVAARVPTVVVVHLEAINHCFETRTEVRTAVPEVLVPEDGETLAL